MGPPDQGLEEQICGPLLKSQPQLSGDSAVFMDAGRRKTENQQVSPRPAAEPVLGPEGPQGLQLMGKPHAAGQSCFQVKSEKQILKYLFVAACGLSPAAGRGQPLAAVLGLLAEEASRVAAHRL